MSACPIPSPPALIAALQASWPGVEVRKFELDTHTQDADIQAWVYDGGWIARPGFLREQHCWPPA